MPLSEKACYSPIAQIFAFMFLTCFLRRRPFMHFLQVLKVLLLLLLCEKIPCQIRRQRSYGWNFTPLFAHGFNSLL